ncbi:MAG: hypothetical protein GY917_28040 [Planctomycetaceae bacterium]|nr:hypothetical protein [Planctomycetaceae bacterium]
MLPFSIVCTTCQARLTVRNKAALGQILQCPKCSSMVAVPQEPGQSAGPAADITPHTEPPPVSEPANISDSHAETVDHYDSADINQLLEEKRATASPSPQPPAAPQAWEGEGSPATPLADHTDTDPILPTDDWTSAASRQVKQRLLMGFLVTISILAAGGIIYVLTSGTPQEPAVTALPGKQEVDQQPNSPGNPVEDTPSPQETAGKEPVIQPDPQDPVEVVPPEKEKDPDAPLAENPPPDNPPGLIPEPISEAEQQAEAAELSQLLQEFSPLLSNTPFDDPANDRPGSQNILPTVKLARPPLRRVNVRDCLDFPIAEFTLNEPVPLHTFLADISSLSGLPIEIDSEALASKNVTLTLPVQIDQKETSVRQLLETVLTPHDLGIIAASQSLTIGYPAPGDQDLQEVSYPIGDLVTVNANGQPDIDLVLWVQTLIAPASWNAENSSYKVQLQENNLVVQHLPAVQFDVLQLLTRLRMARNIKPDSPPDKHSAAISLTPRVQQAEKLLRKTVSINYSRQAPIKELLSHLAKDLDIKVLFNGRTLRQAGWSTRSNATLVTDNEALQQALDILLTPMDLTTRVLNHDTIEITSTAAEQERREIEFYPAGHLLPKNRSTEQLIDLIQKKLGVQRFTADQANQVILVDPVSKYLIIRESQANHRKLTYLLTAG